MVKTAAASVGGEQSLLRALVIVIVLMIRASASAQTPDMIAPDLARALRAGERVIVTARVSCREALALVPENTSAESTDTCIARGKVALLPDGLVVDGRTPYKFRLETIERVERPPDRIWNGALIGYATGLAFFALMELDCRSSPGCWEGLALQVGAMIGAPIGFGIGALTDALIKRPRLAYSKTERQLNLSVSPIITRHAGGVGLAVAF
jgi:hypothetical protein